MALGSALFATKGFAAPEAEQAFARARHLCEQMGDPPELFFVVHGLWAVHFLRLELRVAHEVAEQLLRKAHSANDPTLLMYAHYDMGATLHQMGEFRPAGEHLEAANALYDSGRAPDFRSNGLDAGVCSLSYTSHNLWFLGFPDQSLKRCSDAVTLARTLSHTDSLNFAEGFVGPVRLFRREALEAQEAAEGVIALSAEHGFALWTTFASIHRGIAMIELGHEQEGIPKIQEGLTALRATGTEMGRPFFLGMLSKAFVKTGRFDDGINALTEALVAADEHEDRCWEAETYRLKGELLLTQRNSSVVEARQCFERAIEIARNQSAKSFELRATTSLARLLDKQGNCNEARRMLAEIYNWFTEGFETADLIEAERLLNQWSN